MSSVRCNTLIGIPIPAYSRRAQLYFGARSNKLSVGIVIIGRNEGKRLQSCLQALAHRTAVYVDSGSADGSVPFAKGMALDVLELDTSRPFTAARARNEGFARLQELDASVRYVQFVDGDCEIADGWLERAHSFLEKYDQCAVVCGRLQELHADASIYNRLCQMEWQKQPGEIAACGGIFMIHASSFAEIGGFDPNVIAAEDDELCLRLRRKGWKIVFVDEDMASHDAAMTRFGQWWKRAVRGGYAYAQGVALHGKSDGHFVKDVRRILVWGLILPMTAAALAWPTYGGSLLLFLAYPLLLIKIYRYGRSRGWTSSDARLYAFFTVLAKFPGLLGLLKFHWRRLTGGQQCIIEHKPAASAT